MSMPFTEGEADHGVGALSLQVQLSRLQALTDWERRDRRGMRQDLAPIRDLLARLGDPHTRWRSVHVAGSKGKGTVCAWIAAGLRQSGLRVGCYSSPHLERWNERLDIDGAAVDDLSLAEALREALDAREVARASGAAAAQATLFDVFTAAAFLAAARQGISVCVVEVGLGGLLDSTNVVLPALTVITHIELEHTEVLGHTLEAIAAQKAGIAKAGVPMLSACPIGGSAATVIAEAAARVDAPMHWVTPARPADPWADDLCLARRALDLLGQQGWAWPRSGQGVSGRDLSDALARATRLPGRAERRRVRGPGRWLPVLLDGAHTPDSLEAVLSQQRLPPGSAVLLALASDKPADACIRALARHVGTVVCAPLPAGKACHAPRQLADLAAAQGLSATACSTLEEAWASAQARTGREGVLVVTGSLHLAGAVRAWTEGLPFASDA